MAKTAMIVAAPINSANASLLVIWSLDYLTAPLACKTGSRSSAHGPYGTFPYHQFYVEV
jgi:hypothetical protein